MKKITLVTAALLSVNFLFAFEKNEKENFLLAKKNVFVLNSNNLLNPELKAKKKRGRGGDDAFAEGKIVITAGYGMPNWGKTLLKAFNTYDGYAITGFGPLHIKGEYGLSNKIGLGLSVNYVKYGANWSGTYDTWDPNTWTYTTQTYKEGIDVSSLSFLARMNIHFGTTKKLDPYWGIGAGYKLTSWSFHSDYVSATPQTISSPMPLGFETTIGMRYYFTDNIGAYLEMGWAKSFIQGGLAFKF